MALKLKSLGIWRMEATRLPARRWTGENRLASDRQPSIGAHYLPLGSRYLREDARVESGLGGEQTESNQRLIYICACASPQKCRASAVLAASWFHLSTVSSPSLQRITNQ